MKHPFFIWFNRNAQFIVVPKTTITAQFRFTLVQTVYDVSFNLEGFNETGAFAMLFTDIVYDVEIKRRHLDRVVSGQIEFNGINRTPGPIPAPFYTYVQGYPDNGYTQLVSQEVSTGEVKSHA